LEKLGCYLSPPPNQFSLNMAFEISIKVCSRFIQLLFMQSNRLQCAKLWNCYCTKRKNTETRTPKQITNKL